jgi:prepilin-type N-terminal cleavage/methylation domain-containing protein
MTLMPSQRRAFTYVELTIVLSIVAILAAIAIPNFLEARTRSVVARSKAELVMIKMALEAYRQDARSYPLNRKAGEAGAWSLAALTTPVPYLTAVPMDAFTTEDANGNAPSQPIPYRYFNALQVNPEEALTFQNPAKPGDPKSFNFGGGFIAALAWGYGPAEVPWMNEERGRRLPPSQSSPTRISDKGEALLTAYDPSNGTTSYGDIYQRIP